MAKPQLYLTYHEQMEIVEKLEVLSESKDREAAHGDADGILVDILTRLGYEKIVKAYNKVLEKAHYA